MTDPQQGIGIDYDGTIADTGALKSAWIRVHLSLSVPPWKTDRTLCVPIIGEENYERMGRAVYAPAASLLAEPVPGVGAALRALAAGHRLYVVTARDDQQIASCRAWLERQGLAACITGYLSSAARNPDGSKVSKGQLCRDHGIGVLIDDDERHLRGVDLLGLQRILLKDGCDEPWTPAAGIALATSWTEVLQLVYKGESAP